MMLLDTSFNPLNSFRAPFLLMRLHNLLDYYKFNCRKFGYLKIRHCLIAYYPVVPAFVGTTSNSDMTGFEASGGCRGKGG